MKSIDKLPRVSSPEWPLPGDIVDFTLLNYCDLWKKPILYQKSISRKKKEINRQITQGSSPEWPLHCGD
jgi:hypothetical protein